MNYDDLGYAIGQLMGALMMIAVVVVVIVLIVKSRKSAPPSATDAYWIAAFALMPGERCGFVWQAAHTAGHPMVATITSTGVFALNHYAPQAPPMRLRPEGVAATVGYPSAVTPGAAEPMVEVSLAQSGQTPVSFWIAQSGAQALVAWARPSL
jgi:hypothetical protein